MKKIIIALSILALSAAGQTPKHCAGTTKKGEPCKSTFIMKGTDRCRMHQLNAIYCPHLNQKRERCKMMVKSEGEMCRFHKNATK